MRDRAAPGGLRASSCASREGNLPAAPRLAFAPPGSDFWMGPFPSDNYYLTIRAVSRF